MEPEWSVAGYDELAELGRGGFGRVVLARHDATGTNVAIKYLAPEHLTDPALRGQFRAEAAMLARLADSHVARLHGFVEEPGGAAIVMELVDGVALRRILARHGATMPEAALVVLKGSLMGLKAAHSLGVVHRDYKPENVLVRADGQSTLVDFGIAVLSGSSGMPAGTPAYMAPEQWSGHPASPATDVYAVTCVFFECVAGRHPFHGDMDALMAQHTAAEIPAAEVPEPLRQLVVRGMAKDPAQRPAGAAEFVVELERAAYAGYGPEWEQRGRRQLAALAGGLAALFPLALLASRLGTGPASGSPGASGRTLLGRTGFKAAIAIAGAAVVAAGAVAVLAARGDDNPKPRPIAGTTHTTQAPPPPPGSPSPPVPATPSPTGLAAIAGRWKLVSSPGPHGNVRLIIKPNGNAVDIEDGKRGRMKFSAIGPRRYSVTDAKHPNEKVTATVSPNGKKLSLIFGQGIVITFARIQ